MSNRTISALLCTECPRRQVSYDGKSFKLVPKGTCVSMKTPFGPGSLKPIKRPA